MLKLSTNSPICCLLKRFNSTQINLEFLKAKLCKYDAPNYYEKHLAGHKNISRFKKRASVLIPISIRKDSHDQTVKTYFTLSKRTDKLSSHKGEVCFLGGKKDSDAESDMETAYREAHEEANLDSSALTFLAQLCPLISYQNIIVTPVIAYFDETNFKPILNKEEVTSLYHLFIDCLHMYDIRVSLKEKIARFLFTKT